MAKLHPGAMSRAIQALAQLGYDPEEAEEIVLTAVPAYQAEIERLTAAGELAPTLGKVPRRPSPADWDDEDDESDG